MGDLNPETGKPVELTKATQQEVAADDVTPTVVRFTPQELGSLNVATRLVDAAKANLSLIWRPLQEKYGLADGITYDRSTGEVKATDG